MQNVFYIYDVSCFNVQFLKDNDFGAEHVVQ